MTPTKIGAAKCALLGHPWALGTPPPLTGTRFWRCPRCHTSAGTERQHTGTPNRWLFTFWKGYTASIVDIYTSRG